MPKGDSVQVDVAGGVGPYEYFVEQGGGTISDTGFFTTANEQGFVVIKVVDANGNEVFYNVYIADSNGALDMSYSENGVMSINISDAQVNSVTASVVESQGRLVIGGGINEVNGDSDFALFGVDFEGLLDAGFGLGGYASLDIDNNKDVLVDIDRGLDDKIVACGLSEYAVDSYEVVIQTAQSIQALAMRALSRCKLVTQLKVAVMPSKYRVMVRLS